MPNSSSETDEQTGSGELSSPPEHHVLVVDDDAELRRLVSKLLRASGYRVTAIRSAPEVRHALANTPVDIIILDLMLPGTSGLEICRVIRQNSTVPIIMLTAKSEETDRIVGLDTGADDYMTKPFSSRELLARMRALLRRTVVAPQRPSQMLGYSFLGWHVNTLKRELTNPEGVIIDLSTGEYDLLVALIEQPQKVLTREQLLDSARNRVAASLDRSIDVQISRLRKKIQGSADGETIIKTVRGVGYMFVPAVSWS